MSVVTQMGIFRFAMQSIKKLIDPMILRLLHASSTKQSQKNPTGLGLATSKPTAVTTVYNKPIEIGNELTLGTHKNTIWCWRQALVYQL